MGKRLIQQRRGRGSSTFRSPGFKNDIRVYIPRDVEEGKVIGLVHCAQHSAPIAKIKANTGEVVHAIAPEGLKIGDKINYGVNSDPLIGNVLPLKDMPEGTQIFNIESNPGDGGKFVRASGGAAKITVKTDKYIGVKFPSGKIRKFNPDCRACIGVIAGGGRLEKPLLKAGKAFYKFRAKNKVWPIVCGQSMNAVAHPFGKKGSHTKGRPYQSSRNSPPGRKVGSISGRRSGKKR